MKLTLSSEFWKRNKRDWAIKQFSEYVKKHQPELSITQIHNIYQKDLKQAIRSNISETPRGQVSNQYNLHTCLLAPADVQTRGGGYFRVYSAYSVALDREMLLASADVQTTISVSSLVCNIQILDLALS